MGTEAALLPQAAQKGQQDAWEGLEQLSAGGSPAADTWAALSRANMTGQGLGSIEQPSLQKQQSYRKCLSSAHGPKVSWKNNKSAADIAYVKLSPGQGPKHCL